MKKSFGLFCNEKFASKVEIGIPLLLATSSSKEDIHQAMVKLEALHHWVALEEQRNIKANTKEHIAHILKRSNARYRDVVSFYPLASSGEELHLVPAMGASFFYLKEVPEI